MVMENIPVVIYLIGILNCLLTRIHILLLLLLEGKEMQSLTFYDIFTPTSHLNLTGIR